MLEIHLLVGKQERWFVYKGDKETVLKCVEEISLAVEKGYNAA